MKKLLSLLSILTVSGSVVPNVISAIPYQKNEKSNLENLKRIKKDINNNYNKLYYVAADSWDATDLNSNFLNKKINCIEILKQDSTISTDVKTGSKWIGTDDGLYFQYQNSSEVTKINNLNENVKSINIDYQGSAYVITKIIFNLKNIKRDNLKIDNDNNITILNELNYLNPDLDVSQLEIINKTNNSAIIKSKDNKYFDEFTVNYKIKNKDEVSSIDLNKLIKKALFFKFRDENPNLKFKEINYIDANNLNFANVKVTKKENSFSSSVDTKNICNNKEFINNTPSVKSFNNIPACVYNSKYKLTFQILTGLTKKNEENKLNIWNINSDDEMKLTDFINLNYNKNTEIINELSNNFDLANTNKQEQEMIIYFLNEPSDKFDINPNEKLQVNYSSLRIIKSKNMLNLKQNIMGTISSKIVNSSNEEKIVTLSIKEAMEILQNYNLLPNEIIINKDNNITFNGKASISDEIEGKIKINIIISIV